MIPSNHVVRRFQGKVPVVFYGRTCCSSRSTAALSLASHVAAKDAKLAESGTAKNRLLPNWMQPVESPVNREGGVEGLIKAGPQRLRNIRPFSATQVALFKADPRRVAAPSRQNEIVRHLWKLRANASYRKAQDRRLVTSASVVQHMLQHTQCKFNHVFTTQTKLVEALVTTEDYRARYNRVQLVDRSLLQYCLRGTTAASKHADTIAEALVPKPNVPPNTRLVVALDNVRYPQNIGNIVRTAVGLNVDALFYLRGTADPFDWKVSCITGGLQYMLPYQTGDVKALKRFCKNHKLTPVVAHLEGKEVDDVEITQGLCVILSNESQGPDPEILKFAKRVTLPMHPFVNSLNVSIAGAILIHQLQTRLCELTGATKH